MRNETTPADRTCDTTEMVVVHRVFRREFALLPRLVRAVRVGEVARADRVATHLDELTTALHHHHSNEDEVLWPPLMERVTLESELVARMETQHQTVAELLDRVRLVEPAWRATAAASARDELAAVLDQVETALNEHLTDEETLILPLVERHITEAEWAELGERGRASMPKNRLLVFLGHILEEATPGERIEFLAKLPMPARAGYRLIGQRRFQREVAELRAPLAATT
jgi:hemerythrin-like domain-containing protein